MTNHSVRDIIQIDEELCNGCGRCITGCAEGALALVEGKARLVSDVYCDGLGACLGHCPTGALKVIQRPAPDFDEAAAMQSAARPTGLAAWPIQLKLAPPTAEFLDSDVLILASDCSAFAGPAFHQTFLAEGFPLIIACPKLDDTEPYIEKMAVILKNHPQIRELRIPMMSVPCCGGLGYIAARAMKKAGRDDIRVRTWIITPQGQITEENIR